MTPIPVQGQLSTSHPTAPARLTPIPGTLETAAQALTQTQATSTPQLIPAP